MRHNPDGVVHVRRSTLAAVAAFLVIAAVGRSAPAGTSSWNALNGNFNTTGNWTNGVPGSGDTAVFRRGTAVSYTVTFPGAGLRSDPIDFVTDQLRIGSNTVSFVDGTDFNHVVVASTYTLGNSTTAESGRGIIIGETGGDSTAVFTTRLATLSAVAATIGDAAKSNGTLTISAGTFHVTGSDISNYELIVGNNGTGAVTANGGDVTVTGDTVLGHNAGSHGTVNISNANSAWTNNGDLYVPYYGTGTLNVTSGGTMTKGPVYSCYIGYLGEGGTVNVMGSGSSWTGGRLVVDSNGSLNISDHGQVSDVDDLYVGSTGGGSVNVASGGVLTTANATVKHGGAVTVTGGASFWQSNGSLEVDPSGSISILSGGSFSNTWPFGVIVDGSVTVKGGSTWTTVAGLNVRGTLTVSDFHSSVEGDIDIFAGGLLTGNATAASAGRRLHNDGVVAPGDSVGALTIGGNYTQTAAGTLQIELAGTTPRTQYDQLLVTGSVALAGTLQVSLINGFTASAGMSFDILNWGSLSGTFSTVQLPALAGGLGWDTSQLYTTGVLSVILPGDFNFDGIVDGADYVVWRKGLGTIYTQNDYNGWRAHFGQTPGSGAGTIANAAVPEPTTLLLLILASVGWCLGRVRAV